jgi:uncharacterized protein (TIGR03067 family)
MKSSEDTQRRLPVGKRMWLASGWAAVAIVVLGAGVLRAGDGDRFQGTWRVTFALIGKDEATAGQLKQMRVIVDGDKFTLVNGDKESVVHFELDPTARPNRCIEFYKGAEKKEKLWHGIYVFEGKDLKVCWGPAGSARPKRFGGNEANENRYVELRKR